MALLEEVGSAVTVVSAAMLGTAVGAAVPLASASDVVVFVVGLTVGLECSTISTTILVGYKVGEAEGEGVVGIQGIGLPPLLDSDLFPNTAVMMMPKAMQNIAMLT